MFPRKLVVPRKPPNSVVKTTGLHYLAKLHMKCFSAYKLLEGIHLYDLVIAYLN